MFVEDGTGQGNVAGVNSDNHLLVKSTSEPLYAFIAFNSSELFSWTSQYSATADDVVFYLLNTDPNKYLRINRVIVSSTVSQLWTMNRVLSGTAGGTLITGVNTNFASGKTAQATAYGDAAVTGTFTYSRLNIVYGAAFAANLEGSVILPVNTGINIIANATGGVAVTVSGFYTDLPD